MNLSVRVCHCQRRLHVLSPSHSIIHPQISSQHLKDTLCPSYSRTFQVRTHPVHLHPCLCVVLQTHHDCPDRLKFNCNNGQFTLWKLPTLMPVQIINEHTTIIRFHYQQVHRPFYQICLHRLLCNQWLTQYDHLFRSESWQIIVNFIILFSWAFTTKHSTLVDRSN